MTTFTRYKEAVIRWSFFLCAFVSIVTTAGIFWVLAYESFGFFQVVSPFEFFFGTQWTPLLEPRHYGILPLVCGTLLVAGGALIVALPIGLASALFMSEYAPPWFRNVFKPILEILVGIPTVVYGYFALTFITPYILKPLFPNIGVFNAASAAIVVGVMIIPTISSLCDDAFRAVPRSLREAAYALSATRLEVASRIVLPAGLSGVAAAVLLGFARAIGETMAVTIAAGATAQLTLNPMESVQTLTAYIVAVSLGDTPADSLEYKTLFACALALFLMTLSLNVIAYQVTKRYREAYE